MCGKTQTRIFCKSLGKKYYLEKRILQLDTRFGIKRLKINVGGLAQLARAFGWQPKGHRFESGILHETPRIIPWSFFMFEIQIDFEL